MPRRWTSRKLVLVCLIAVTAQLVKATAFFGDYDESWVMSVTPLQAAAAGGEFAAGSVLGALVAHRLRLSRPLSPIASVCVLAVIMPITFSATFIPVLVNSTTALWAI